MNVPNGERREPGTALWCDEIARTHDTGPGHPECPQRFDAVSGALDRAGITSNTLVLHAQPATREQLERVHTPGYIDLVQREINNGYTCLTTGDTTLCPATWDAALHAAGSGVAAVDAVVGGRARNAFCAVRPPGHHATPDRGMGFCVFNNVAVAARHAQAVHGIEQILIVDWDVHHGNGTQDCFYADGSIFYFSIHQWPLYPGTGASAERGSGQGLGTTLNIPVPAGTDGKQVMAAFEKHLLPAMELFMPHLVLLSAGFDSRVDDPLGAMKITDDDFVSLTRLMMNVADRYAGGRLVSILEGGYNLDGLARAVTAHVGALMEST